MPFWPPNQPMPKRLTWETAIAGALAIHCLFAYLFRPPAHQARPNGSATRAACLFMPLSGPASPDEKTLALWGEIADPTLLSLPSPTHGFSQFLTAKDQPPLSPPPTPPLALSRLNPPEFPVLRLASPAEDLAASMSRQWSVSVPLRDATAAAPALARGVIWRFEDGTPLANPGDVPAAELQAALAAGKAQRPTRIQVMLQEKSAARVVLRDGCGNAALDALALQRVAVRAMEWERSLAFKQPSTETERFSFASGFTDTVEVEWRLVPETAAAATPATTPAATGPAGGVAAPAPAPAATPAPKPGPGEVEKKSGTAP